MEQQRTGMLKKVYLYLVSLIALVMLIVACVSLINLALRAWVFKQADNTTYNYSCPMIPASAQVPDGSTSSCNTALQQQQAHAQLVSSRETESARDIALIIVGLPVFFYHWRLVRKETD
jgi:glucan phosphoethanolaminetransferase (alkaline phosphatase superfamily)